MNLHRFHFFFSFIHEMPWLLRKNNELVPCCLLLDWLPPKARQSSLSYYLFGHDRRNWFMLFSRSLVRSECHRDGWYLNSACQFHIPYFLPLYCTHAWIGLFYQKNVKCTYYTDITVALATFLRKTNKDSTLSPWVNLAVALDVFFSQIYT